MANKLEDLRKLKDQAAKAVEKRQYEKAADLYLTIAEREPDPDWHQRAGESLKRAGQGPRAVAALTVAADGYANGGFLLKAIAVTKMILQIDATQVAMQVRLAELYARRDGVPAAPAAAVPAPAPASAPAPALTATAPVYSVAPTAPENGVDAAVVGPPQERPGFSLDVGFPSSVAPLFPLAATPTAPPIEAPPPTAPMDALPLRRVLPSRRSEQFAVADVLAAAEAAPPAAYEIELEPDFEPPAAPPSIPSPVVSPSPPPAPAPIALAEETDFGDVLPIELPVPAPPPASARSVAGVAPLPTIADELDFSSVVDEAPAAAIAPAPAKPPLPVIPLFSSLPEEELRMLIERTTLLTPEPGATLVRQGDRGGSLYVLVEGEARVLSGEAEIARLRSGDFFGEVGLLTDDPRTASIVADTACMVLEIGREVAWELARRSPEVLRTLLRFLRDRLVDRLLATSRLFTELSPDDGRRLATEFLFLELEPGVAVVRQGERAPGLFFLLSGAAEAVRDGVQLGRLGTGDLFGEMSLLLRAPATANVTAITKCWALMLPKERFQEIMVTYPQVLEYVSELDAERREKLTQHRVDLV